ncbi:serine/threonine-protein kinase [Corallococcus llansteffanensis]|uniref:PEGA domain-containing protein n=1 Tax=Corallococcus llansteffanensis TaxID=2316731 RepID=A0A3A8QNE4_9BACT|nr:serine/threonine-protein kinase [Corallococcus llansteffanensis]RKH66372.1 PEGA domain-containing protein [Corallococcus llansteffanensis]
MGYGNIGPPMALHKQPSSCATCGLPLPFAGSPCAECTAITQHVGEAGWRARTSARRSLTPGDLLEGKWRLEELLGAGGMGQVYRALDVALERTVAIKLLHEALCEDPESVARFEREARAMARLEHPHITPIHAVGQERGRPFIVMKHLEGMSLARYLRSVPGPLPVAEVLALARQLCAGLDFIHQRGCVHRDIKPANIFLSPGGRATLLDFGILWEHRGEEATRSGLRLGTPSYMAPEQARGEAVDGRADLYSLGLVLLEALTGLPPATTCRLLGEGPRDAARALRDQAPWLSLPLAEVLVRVTAMDPEQRHAGALALLAAMEDAERVAASPLEGAGPSVTPAAHAVRLPWRKRVRPLSLAALGGVGVAALLFGALTLWNMHGAPASSSPEAPAKTEAHALLAATASSASNTPVSGAAPKEPDLMAASASDTANVPGTMPAPKAPGPVAASATDAASTPEPRTTAAPVSKTAPTHRARIPARSAPSPLKGNAPRQVATQGQGELRVVTVHDGKTVWADVSVDGKHHGATPVSLELPQGRHSVRVERDGFAPQQRQVEIVPGTKAVVRIELRP